MVEPWGVLLMMRCLPIKPIYNWQNWGWLPDVVVRERKPSGAVQCYRAMMSLKFVKGVALPLIESMEREYMSCQVSRIISPCANTYLCITLNCVLRTEERKIHVRNSKFYRLG